MRQNRSNNRNATRKLAAAASFELQHLENRTMMTATPLSVKFSLGVLSVTGTPGNDQIVISHVGNSWTVSNGEEWTVTKTFKTVTKVGVNAKAGDDTITLDSSVTQPATLLGDLGNDTITGALGASSISGGVGDDSLTGGSAANIITGDAGNDTLVGGAINDKLVGGAGNDSINGNNGNDVVIGGFGNDTMAGDAGTDTIDYSDHTVLQPVTADLGAGTAGAMGESDSFDASFEKFNGSAGNDSITGTSGNDLIYGQGGNDTINAMGGADKVYDGVGNDSVSGGDGNDSLYSNNGLDALYGDEGDDDLIAVGGNTADSVTGGNGNDSFWIDNSVNEKVMDADMTETANGAVHKINVFRNTTNKELTGARIADPKLTSTSFKYRTFADRKIFASAGPSIDDIAQGQVGDCYFLATIASIAKVNPMRLKQSIVNLGDGTYAVQFFKSGVANYVRVDNDLPTYSWSTTQLGYVSFGAEGSMWAPLIEKAFAYFRKGVNTYASISSGLMGEVYTAFGISSTSITPGSAGNATAYVNSIKDLLDQGKSVTAGVWSTGGANMVTGHAYTIDSVVDNGDGTYGVKVRNPWGVDGYSSTDGTNDGYVTLTAAQAYVALGLVTAASV